MRIGLDLTSTIGKKTGFGFYAKNLFWALKKEFPTVEWIAIKKKMTSVRDLNSIVRYRWDQIELPKVLRQKNLDLFHQPAFSLPVKYRGKKIITAHDIIANVFPYKLTLPATIYWRKILPRSFFAADLIIADSKNTKRDLITVLKLPARKIKVVPLGIGNEYKPSSQNKIEATKKKFKISRDYFYTVSTLEPRKNFLFLLKCYAATLKEKSDLPSLVITGKIGWDESELIELAKSEELQSKIIFTGYISDQEKINLYSGAVAFLFPSLYEGFGLPPLEAMACGAPVIASNTSSIPEVVEDAGILLDLKEKQAWIENIIKISENKNLRQKLLHAGRKQAKKFSWQKCARLTMSAYLKVIGGK